MSVFHLFAIRMIVVVSIFYAAFDLIHSLFLSAGIGEIAAFFVSLLLSFAIALNHVYIVKGLTWKDGFWG